MLPLCKPFLSSRQPLRAPCKLVIFAPFKVADRSQTKASQVTEREYR